MNYFVIPKKRSLFVQNILHLKNSKNFTFWFIRDLFKCTLHFGLPGKLVQIRKTFQLKQKTYIAYLQSKCKLRVKKRDSQKTNVKSRLHWLWHMNFVIHVLICRLLNINPISLAMKWSCRFEFEATIFNNKSRNRSNFVVKTIFSLYFVFNWLCMLSVWSRRVLSWHIQI